VIINDQRKSASKEKVKKGESVLVPLFCWIIRSLLTRKFHGLRAKIIAVLPNNLGYLFSSF